MDAPNPHPSGPATLKTLLTAAGLTSCRLDPSHRGLIYPGRTRDWLLILSLNAEWLHAYVVVCDLPREAGVTLGNLTAYLHAMAEKHYPHIFRIVSGDEVLDALAESFQAPEAAA